MPSFIALVRKWSCRRHTRLICSDHLFCYSFLLRHLVLEMLLALLQHVQLLPQRKDGLFGRILARLGAAAAAEPAPHCAVLLSLS